MFRALEYLHGRARPMVHRDVKPANLLLAADLETLKLADFGVRPRPARAGPARARMHGHSSAAATRTVPLRPASKRVCVAA